MKTDTNIDLKEFKLRVFFERKKLLVSDKAKITKQVILLLG
jgi:hypothetical protein